MTVAIIGGGIAGLSAAWFLKERGIDSVIYESSAHIGGVIGSSREDGFLIESGPRSMIETPLIARLITGLNLESERVVARPGKRFIYHKGKLVNAFSLLSLRALGEPFIRSRSEGDESIASFVTRRFGKKTLDYLVDPFVSGIYAGDPAQLSIREAMPKLYDYERRHGSVIKGVLKERSPKKPMISFKGGLATLPRALAEKSTVRQTAVTAIRVTAEHAAVNDETFAAMICTVPLHTLHAIDTNLDFSSFSEVRYAPVTVKTLAYRREDIGHPCEGFGFLVPSCEKRNILGAIFSSSIFPDHAPKNTVLLSAFFSGEPDLGEISDLLSIKGEPLFSRTSLHPRAIPQYEIGYRRHKEKMDAIETAHPRFRFAGAYRNGVSIGDTVESALQAATLIRNSEF